MNSHQFTKSVLIPLVESVIERRNIRHIELQKHPENWGVMRAMAGRSVVDERLRDHWWIWLEAGSDGEALFSRLASVEEARVDSLAVQAGIDDFAEQLEDWVPESRFAWGKRVSVVIPKGVIGATIREQDEL